MYGHTAHEIAGLFGRGFRRFRGAAVGMPPSMEADLDRVLANETDPLGEDGGPLAAANGDCRSKRGNRVLRRRC
jgi:hypothetical protein